MGRGRERLEGLLSLASAFVLNNLRISAALSSPRRRFFPLRFDDNGGYGEENYSE